MRSKLLLVIPPFSQLNTAYPSTAYLKGFLEDKKVATTHIDLSIELFTAIFTANFLQEIFAEAAELDKVVFPWIMKHQKNYVVVVDTVIGFLQAQDLTMAEKILEEDFLPLGHRLAKVNKDIQWAEGELGVIDRAKHHATLFVEEIGDFIQANVDEFFSFTKYAEQIATSASSFNEIDEFLNYEPTIIEGKMLDIFAELCVVRSLSSKIILE